MQADTIKLAYTYTIATILIMGGLAFLYFSRLDPPNSSSSQYGLLIAGFIASATTFVFQREAQTSVGRMVERATAAGAASQPNVTTTSNPPNTTTTVTQPNTLTGDKP